MSRASRPAPKDPGGLEGQHGSGFTLSPPGSTTRRLAIPAPPTKTTKVAPHLVTVDLDHDTGVVKGDTARVVRRER